MTTTYMGTLCYCLPVEEWDLDFFMNSESRDGIKGVAVFEDGYHDSVLALAIEDTCLKAEAYASVDPDLFDREKFEGWNQKLLALAEVLELTPLEEPGIYLGLCFY